MVCNLSSGFGPKYGYDVDENGYLVPCEKEPICNQIDEDIKKKKEFL